MVTPAQQLRAIAGELAPYVKDGQPLVICSKGIEQTTGKLMSQVVARGAARRRDRRAVGAELRRRDRARAAGCGDAGDAREESLGRGALPRAQPSAVPLLLERRRDRAPRSAAR